MKPIEATRVRKRSPRVAYDKLRVTRFENDGGEEIETTLSGDVGMTSGAGVVSI